ncbi:WXG100 family type VII secretion target [Nocardia terpenica]|uniref:ESAT-6-like protein n=1 Tax=Nocardia terpenica TaxID=455432 RepID=A0A291REQ8_9NOCA|nr:WXG100 family type VII secretion target [Nocardia terpenica]ATL65789.1 hypothetical protein CRH09_05725 [Nocardia terpenica]
MTMQYKPDVIIPRLGDLNGRNLSLRAENEQVKQAANKLLAIWKGQSADAFVNAKLQWDNEFENLAQMLDKIVKFSNQAVESAVATDVANAAGFGH